MKLFPRKTPEPGKEKSDSLSPIAGVVRISTILIEGIINDDTRKQQAKLKELEDALTELKKLTSKFDKDR